MVKFHKILVSGRTAKAAPGHNKAAATAICDSAIPSKPPNKSERLRGLILC